MRDRGDPPAEGGRHHRLWGGRFAGGSDPAFDVLNRSLPVDYRLWEQDLLVSEGWVEELSEAGTLGGDERRRLLDGLASVRGRLEEIDFRSQPDEDIHTLVERLLYEEVGEVAGKLGTGRSRNDQVATDLRLWTAARLETIRTLVGSLGTALLDRADEGIKLFLPGYTHGQRAQPVRWAFVLLAHAWPLARDQQALKRVARSTLQMPLGSAALAGTGVPIDRDRLAARLGFIEPVPNALDATGDRDFVAETLFCLALLGVHLSRLSSELFTYCSQEYGFVRLSDEFSSGSSFLPQKQNPDVLELCRAKSARLTANLNGLLSTVRTLPAGYSKDLQEDKHYLFDSVDQLEMLVPALTGTVQTLEPQKDRMLSALDEGLYAADVADRLVDAGLAFREAHHVVGRLVRRAEEENVPLSRVDREFAAALHPNLPAILAESVSEEASVERRGASGGSSRSSVRDQITSLRSVFD